MSDRCHHSYLSPNIRISEYSGCLAETALSCAAVSGYQPADTVVRRFAIVRPFACLRSHAGNYLSVATINKWAISTYPQVRGAVETDLPSRFPSGNQDIDVCDMSHWPTRNAPPPVRDKNLFSLNVRVLLGYFNVHSLRSAGRWTRVSPSAWVAPLAAVSRGRRAC